MAKLELKKKTETESKKADVNLKTAEAECYTESKKARNESKTADAVLLEFFCFKRNIKRRDRNIDYTNEGRKGQRVVWWDKQC
jgi:hypothetical protein